MITKTRGDERTCDVTDARRGAQCGTSRNDGSNLLCVVVACARAFRKIQSALNVKRQRGSPLTCDIVTISSQCLLKSKVYEMIDLRLHGAYIRAQLRSYSANLDTLVAVTWQAKVAPFYHVETRIFPRSQLPTWDWYGASGL